jgi:head-tail adaptor
MTREFAGALRERILIERPVARRTAMGLQEDGYEKVCRALAAIEPDGAGAEAEAQALSAMPRFRVTMRPRDGIAVGQKITWGDIQLMIRQLLHNPLERDRLVLRCEQVRL